MASCIGILITVMVAFNGILASYTGNIQSIPFIHIAGLLTASIILIFKKEKRKSISAPFYLYTAGIIGVVLTLINNLCFSTIGVSLFLTLGILGQTMGSLIADSTGFLGMKKYPFQNSKLVGLIILFLGILVMVDKWEGEMVYMILAFVAGILVILTMIINTQLSLRVGILNGVQINFTVGLIFTILILLIFKIPMWETFRIIKNINPSSPIKEINSYRRDC